MNRQERIESIRNWLKSCKQHHAEKGYDKLPKVVREFEL